MRAVAASTTSNANPNSYPNSNPCRKASELEERAAAEDAAEPPRDRAADHSTAAERAARVRAAVRDGLLAEANLEMAAAAAAQRDAGAPVAVDWRLLNSELMQGCHLVGQAALLQLLLSVSIMTGVLVGRPGRLVSGLWWVLGYVACF